MKRPSTARQPPKNYHKTTKTPIVARSTYTARNWPEKKCVCVYEVLKSKCLFARDT